MIKRILDDFIKKFVKISVINILIFLTLFLILQSISSNSFDLMNVIFSVRDFFLSILPIRCIILAAMIAIVIVLFKSTIEIFFDKKI